MVEQKFEIRMLRVIFGPTKEKFDPAANSIPATLYNSRIFFEKLKLTQPA
jgi:hypothetical protein